MAPKKKIASIIKLQIQAGQATPAPPVGPALGAAGVNMMEFVKAYNDRTADQRGNIIPVEITVYEDRSFTFITKTPPAAELIKKAAGLQKGSAVPHTDKVGKITQAQVREIAETKMPDLNANDMEAAAKIVAGTGNNVTAHTIDLSRRSADAGADGILLVTPYYSKPTQPAIEAHMRAAADSTDLPVMLYDIPGRAGAPIITDTLLRLSDHPNILAVKDAKGDLFASSFVMNNSSLVYYSGEDALNLPLLSLGALGLVSVAGHVCSDRFAAMVSAVANNDLNTARTLSRDTADVVDALMNHMPGVISAKAALQAQGILDNRDVRMPLLPADEEQMAFVAAQLTRSGYLSE